MEIGRTLHLRTVAEGIETPDQLDGAEPAPLPLRPGLPLRSAGAATQITAMLAGQKSFQRAPDWTRSRPPCYNLS